MTSAQAKQQFDHDKAWAARAIVKDGRLAPFIASPPRLAMVKQCP